MVGCKERAEVTYPQFVALKGELFHSFSARCRSREVVPSIATCGYLDSGQYLYLSVLGAS
jgi:hypothetical protein